MTRPHDAVGSPVDNGGAAAAAMFGAALPLAEQYAALLRGDGVEHGHLGPREADRLWERHLLNCAVVTDLIPVGAGVVDVGSGAGLPGLPMAIRRPDLQVTLLEPMQRRVHFLQRCVDELALVDRVAVVRGRAGEAVAEQAVGLSAFVTARAVAPLDRLVRWCLSLLSDDGVLLALKGERAADEVAEHRTALRQAGVDVRSIDELSTGDGVTRVVVLARAPSDSRSRNHHRRGGR